MSLKILEQKKNALMGRDEVKAIYEHHGRPTPTREEILPSLESVLKAKAEVILVERIFTTKGKGESLVKAFVYESREKIPKHKLEVLQKRKAKKGKAAEAEAPAPAKQEKKA